MHRLATTTKALMAREVMRGRVRSVLQRGLASAASLILGFSVALAASGYDGQMAQAAVVEDDVQPSHEAPPAPVASPVESPVPEARTKDAVGADPGKGLKRLPGHVLDAVSNATADPAAPEPKQAMTLTLVLKRDRQADFNEYMKGVYDEHSSQYHRFLTQAELTKRFGPSRSSYKQLENYLRASGFETIARSKNRLTLTVSGMRPAVEKTFALKVRDYRLRNAAFYANDSDPAMPIELADRVADISGLANLAVPHGTKEKYPEAWSLACGGTPGMNPDFVEASGAVGTGIGAGLVQAYGASAPAWAFAVYPAAAYVGLFGSIFFVAAFEWQYLCALDATDSDGLVNAPEVAPEPGPAGAKSFLKSIKSTSSGNQTYYSVARQYDSFMPRAAFGTTQQTNNANALYGTYAADGTGQTIGLLEFDTYLTSDVTDYLQFTQGSSKNITNLSEVPVNGGAVAGPDQDEVLLDIGTVMSIAPGAKVVVYDAPFSGLATSYSAIFNAMINGGVTIISNSWSSCEDQVSKADAMGIDQVLQTAAASGISVFNGTGDSGSTCLDGKANTIGVPADSPNATAVGGTTLHLGPAFTYKSETWWDGSNSTPQTGQGGYGVSQYFSRPSYQNGLIASSMRSVPDVAIDADPQSGALICQASAGGCPVSAIYGGTSMSTPEWAAYGALLNEAAGKNLGAFNPQIYKFANTSAFHSAAPMGSDFSHVGLGSPNVDRLYLSLTAQSAGTPSAATSVVVPLVPYSVLSGGTSSASALVANIGDDGMTAGGVLVRLYDNQGNGIGGKTVTLNGSASSAKLSTATAVTAVDGTAVFTVTDLATESVTYTAVDTTDGITLSQTAVLNFVPPSASSAGITANPATVPADGQSAATLVVTLKDALNRPSPGKTVTISDGSGHAVITGPTPAVTDANGQIQFTATDQIDETVTFSAVDVSDANLAIPGTGTVSYSGSTSTACGLGTQPVAGTGYAATPYITGLPAAANLYYGGANIGCPGANAPAFTSVGSVLITDFDNGSIYQTSLYGGAVSTSNLLGTLAPALGPLVYGKDGSAYATLGNSGAEIVQIDPTTGAQLRVVAANLTCPAGLAVDPLSGDLFFDDQCTGGGTDNASIFRVIDPANTNTSSPTSVVVYATLPATPNGLMAFAPNGTLYAVSSYVSNPTVQQVSGTNSATVSVSPVSGITSSYGIAIGATNADGSAQSLIVTSSAGAMSDVPIASPSTATVIISANSPTVGVTGPDGCMYAAGYNTIFKITNSTGACVFAPTSPAPSLSLTPITVVPNPAQGSSQTFTATLKNVATLSGVPVTFRVSGANAQTQLVNTDVNGNAALTYTATASGLDVVLASAATGSTAVTSNNAQVTWTAGKHVSFLSLNSSPQGGAVNTPVNVSASLTDVSASPAASLAGQSVVFTLDGTSCTASTSSRGVATCSLTPSVAGSGTLTASFAGSSTFAAATQSVGFHVAGIPTPAPTVTISVSPTSIAAGSPATLTWSSTKATACTASGSWTGSEVTSGTQSVTPSANGSYSYTLTCSGAGGTGTATAVLSATLVAVTVTAKSGGGALTWYTVLGLGLLVLLRFKRGGVHASATILSILTFVFAAVDPAHADQLAADPVGSWADPLYVGVRVGDMPLRQDSSKIDQGLAALGFSDVSATSHNSGAAGTVFAGYEFLPAAALELGYTFRESTTAHLTGTIPSRAELTPLLQDTTELTRGYGNIVSLSYSGRFEVLPRFSLEPRLGGFFWATKATAISLDDRIDTTHEGGGSPSD